MPPGGGETVGFFGVSVARSGSAARYSTSISVSAAGLPSVSTRPENVGSRDDRRRLVQRYDFGRQADGLIPIGRRLAEIDIGFRDLMDEVVLGWLPIGRGVKNENVVSKRTHGEFGLPRRCGILFALEGHRRQLVDEVGPLVVFGDDGTGLASPCPWRGRSRTDARTEAGSGSRPASRDWRWACRSAGSAPRPAAPPRPRSRRRPTWFSDASRSCLPRTPVEAARNRHKETTERCGSHGFMSARDVARRSPRRPTTNRPQMRTGVAGLLACGSSDRRSFPVQSGPVAQFGDLHRSQLRGQPRYSCSSATHRVPF